MNPVFAAIPREEQATADGCGCGGWPRPLHEVRSFVTEAIKTGHCTPSPAGKEEARLTVL
jgi:hypothetical protein